VRQSSATTIQKGVELKDEELAIDVFPNPSKDGIFYLQSDGKEMQLDVFDLKGRLIFSRKTSSNTEKIDLSRQTSGLYLLRIIKDGRQRTLKLIM
jgi:hypothetical protein